MQWSVREPDVQSEWSTRSNQNGSNELYHYGILGMKWGVRRTPEQLGHKETKTITSTGRIPKDYKGYTNAEKRSIQNNRWEFCFGSSSKRNEYDTGDKYHISNLSTGKTFDMDVYDPRISRDGYKTIDIRFRGSGPDGKKSGSYAFSPDLDDNYEEMVAFVLGCSEEEAAEIIAQADKNWLIKNGLADKVKLDTDEEEDIYERTDPEELFKKNTEYTIKRATQKRQTKNEEVAKSKLSQLSDSIEAGAKQVVSIIKEVGSKALDSAKDVIDSGKAWIDQMFKKK